jgi:peroxiredoxin
VEETHMNQLSIINSVLLWVVVLFNLILTFALMRKLALSSNSRPAEPAGLDTGVQAPGFTARTLQDQPVTLDTFAGHPTAFLIVMPNCQPCRESLPKYEALYPQAKRSGSELVLVSTGDPEATHALVDEFNLTMPVIVAPTPDNPFNKDYKIRGTPSYCIVSSTGEVKSSGYPNFNGGEWKRFVDSLEASQS